MYLGTHAVIRRKYPSILFLELFHDTLFCAVLGRVLTSRFTACLPSGAGQKRLCLIGSAGRCRGQLLWSLAGSGRGRRRARLAHCGFTHHDRKPPADQTDHACPCVCVVSCVFLKRYWYVTHAKNPSNIRYSRFMSSLIRLSIIWVIYATYLVNASYIT